MASSQGDCSPDPTPIVLDYDDLLASKDLSDAVTEAFGPDGIGLLLVQGVPGFAEARKALLPTAYKLANLAPEQLAQYEHEKSAYSVGWSKGREMLAKDVPDTLKGSFYGNPLTDAATTDEMLIEELPGMYTPNIWPKEVPELEGAFKTMGQLMKKVALMVGQQISNISKKNGGTFSISGVTEANCAKGRLLYYYPRDEESKDDDMWCGWHNDHGSLTALCPSMYFDDNGDEAFNGEGPPPALGAGLLVKTRKGEIMKLLGIRRDMIAFQIGEAAQITSGGAICATPHAVMGPKVQGISRATFALFMDPVHHFDMKMVPGGDAKSIQDTEHLPKNIPPLASRWDPSKWTGQDNTYGAFTTRTYKAYYPYLYDDSAEE